MLPVEAVEHRVADALAHGRRIQTHVLRTDTQILFEELFLLQFRLRDWRFECRRGGCQ